MKSDVYKAQWPLAGTMEPMILIYRADRQGKDYFMPATKQARKTLFQDRYIKVYFRGSVQGDTIHVDEFVRQDEWL